MEATLLPPTDSPALSSLRILIIEDDPNDLRYIQESLSDALDVAPDFTTCDRLNLAMQSFQWADLDMVFMDLNLPDSSWLDTLHSIQKQGMKAPIVVLTGINDDGIGQQAIRAGAQDYLVKGQFNVPILTQTVMHALERHKLIVDLQQSHERKWRLANVDVLTNLPNRRAFEESLNQAITHAHRTREMFALLLVDLDRCKSVNDLFGRRVCDLVLTTAAERLRVVVRESDIVGRYGDDEFAILLHDLKQPEKAALVANKIVQALTAPFVVDDRIVTIGISVGIAVYPMDSAQSNELLQFAGMAMYNAKDGGGDSYHFYSEQLEASASDQLTMENQLRQALVGDELLLHYQPSIDLASGAIVSLEALIRWRHRTQGLLLPQAFVPLAENSNMILELDFWVLQQACRQNKQWQQQGHYIRLAVNISARHFRRPQLLTDRVYQVLEETGLAPRWLEIEITETALMHDPLNAAESLRELQQFGVHITLDDFGVGYSSLSYLNQLPVDTVKIDRSFLANVPDGGKNSALLGGILTLANTLNLKIVAEGVESLEQVQWLRNATCHSAQGYFFSYPEAQPRLGLARNQPPEGMH